MKPMAVLNNGGKKHGCMMRLHTPLMNGRFETSHRDVSHHELMETIKIMRSTQLVLELWSTNSKNNTISNKKEKERKDPCGEQVKLEMNRNSQRLTSSEQITNQCPRTQ